MALLLWRLKDNAGAERYFRRALHASGANSDTWNNFGVFLCETGKLDDADDAFKRALEDPLYKTPAEANINAGMCQMRKPSPKAAERYFRAALDINPAQPQALLELAKLTYNDGRSLSARAFIQRYFSVAPETPASLLLANKIEGVLGNNDAEASYAVKLRGKFPDAPEVAQLKPTPKPRAPAPAPKPKK
jgi:type IV pilus assembly protein PilF